MFHCSNEEFLLSFGASEDNLKQINVIEDNNKIEPNEKKIKILENKECIYNDAIEIGLVGENLRDSPPKRGTIIKKFSLGDCFPKNRKMSEENIEIKDKKEVQMEEQIKSDASYELSGNDVIEEVESGKSIQNKSYAYDIKEVEGSYMRKIRNLEARIKNMNLNHKTIVIKLHQENQRLSKENNLYQSFVQNYCPQVIQELNKFMEEQLEKLESFSMPSSSSSQSNDEIMPIMSKIQELKIDGGKMAETIKNYQEILAKKNEIDEEIMRLKVSEKKEESPLDIKKRLLLRKYSIPVGLQREKKLSFNTNNALILGIKETEVTDSSIQPESFIEKK